MVLPSASSQGAILLGQDHQVQTFEWPHKTVARFQAVGMPVSQFMVTSRWPTEDQLLQQLWCSSVLPVSGLRELRNLFTLYFWVVLLPLLLPELNSCGER